MSNMPQRKLGNTGVFVSAIGMGCMPLSLGNRPTEELAQETLEAAYHHGITFFDTADAYCLDDTEIGHNERLLGKVLKGKRDVVIATKGGNTRPGGRWVPDGRPEHLKAACEASLRALGQEAIALYQLHRPDPNVPFEESVGALARLKEEGKIVHVGLSNVSVDQLRAALKIVTIASVQNRMNLFDRSSMEVMKECEKLGMAFLPYSPLNGMSQAGQLGENEALARIAVNYGVSPQRVALAWLLNLSPSIVPIPGASKARNIADCAQAFGLELSHEDIQTLDKLA